MAKIDGAKVLITGASSGIGQELARQLASRGCRLALLARREDRLKELAGELGEDTWFRPCDVVDKEAVKAAVEDADEALGGIDIVILNAGVGKPTPTHKFVADDLVHIFQVNVFGIAYALEALLPRMLERGRGAIVGVSSLAGTRGLPLSTAYGASKAAVTNLLEGMRIELAPQGIQVTTVAPGFVKTPMTDQNKFPMPFMWPVDKAARVIIRGIEKGAREIRFPFPLVATLALAKMAPNGIWDFLAGKASPRKLAKKK